MPHKKEVAPRKERKAFMAMVLGAIVLLIAGVMIVSHILHTQHPPAAVNTQP